MVNEKTLHITNGSILTGILKELDYSGDILTWEEMLCEGPTMSTINSDTFLKKRASFFNSYYDIELDIEEQMTRAIMNSIRSDIVADIISLDLCDIDCDVIHYLEKTARA